MIVYSNARMVYLNVANNVANYVLSFIFKCNIMSTSFWKPPAWEVPTSEALQVELLKLRDRSIIPGDNWPASFWTHVADRKIVEGDEAQHIIQLFQGLTVGEPMRCHMPPWGLAFYDSDKTLLFTVTVCFECSNAYVYTASGSDLRAFDVSESDAERLLTLLQRSYPV